MISQSECIRDSYKERNRACIGCGPNRNGVTGVCSEANDMDEDLLSRKMNSFELCDEKKRQQTNFCDGSDSGVDIAITTTTTATTTSTTTPTATIKTVRLQRALSNNSGGYASSTFCGADESLIGCKENISCDSSMISYSSDMGDFKTLAKTSTNAVIQVETPTLNNQNYECCSENGSESSSIAGGNVQTSTGNRKVVSSVKKKVAMFEPHGTPTGRFSCREKDFHATTTTAGQLNNGSSNNNNNMCNTTPNRIRSKCSGLTRTSSLTRHSAGESSGMPQIRDRARSREKSIVPTTGNKAVVSRPSQIRAKSNKPDTFPTTFGSTSTSPHTVHGMQRLAQRTPSLSRARTPGTPSDDGRWPHANNTRRGMSVTPEISSAKMRVNMLSMEVKLGTSANPYSTLPRRRKQKSVEDLTGRSSRSSSTSRDPVSNQRLISSVIVSSRRSLVNSYAKAVNMTPVSTVNLGRTSSLARSKKIASIPKTRIYHEVEVQTAITGQDFEKMLNGAVPILTAIDAPEFRNVETQSDIRDRELERFRDEIRRLRQSENDLISKLNDRSQRINQLEYQLRKEREEKLVIQRELHLNTERVMGMLELTRLSGTPNDGDDDDDNGQCDSLLMLESQIQMSGHELHEKQQEISKLRQICRTLQAEMQRSLVMQENLLQEKVAIEQESNELHDFLQHEKAAMCDALKDLEKEYQSCKRLLTTKEEEIKVLRDECRHLVRLNEQRRQENRLLQSKYVALENKSKELLSQQNTSVSNSLISLSGLQSRLDKLVEQLVASYNISEQDLEDLVFHNEASVQESCGYDGDNYGNADEKKLGISKNNIDTAGVGSFSQISDGSLSPQRNQSFIAAVISAIRHATAPSAKKLLSRSKKDQPQTKMVVKNEEESDSTTEMLDSETEPCLMMDNVLEDVTMPDTHSHNMISTTACPINRSHGKDIISSELVKAIGDESLQNLSQAITNRQQMELKINSLSVNKLPLQLSHLDDQDSVSEDIVSCHDSLSEMPSLAEYFSPQTMVEQVIEVDTLVTKLLKVLRLIQMDNDNCIQQLIMDKNKLQQNKEDMLEKLKDLEDINIKLQDELMDATQELMLKNNDLSNANAEMQRHRNEIDRLTLDICNLSTLCSNSKQPTQTTLLPAAVQNDITTKSSTKECADVLGSLKVWQQEGQLQQEDVLQYLYRILLPKDHHCPCEFNGNYNDSPSEKLQVLENIQNLQLRCKCPESEELHQELENVKLQLSNHAIDNLMLENSLNANEVTVPKRIPKAPDSSSTL